MRFRSSAYKGNSASINFTMVNTNNFLWIIPGAPLAGAILLGLISIVYAKREQKPPRSLIYSLAIAGPTLSLICAVATFFAVKNHGPQSQILYTWIESGPLRINLGLMVDQLSGIMILFVTFIGTLIHIYSTGYMAHDKGYVRFFAFLNLFLFSMLILVLGDNMLILFVGWEGVGLCSYLLIGFWFDDEAKASAGKKAFIINRVGDFGFILGIFLIFWQMQKNGQATLDFQTLRENALLLAPIALPAGLLLFLGACGKSAQIPLYIWLPDAMAGPTPVSALIHAATMVTAGVYMVARMFFLYDLPEAEMAQTTIATVGAVTALFAATIGLFQNDIKKILAYSTVSQLGYMFLGVGVGAYAFKCILFNG